RSWDCTLTLAGTRAPPLRGGAYGTAPNLGRYAPRYRARRDAARYELRRLPPVERRRAATARCAAGSPRLASCELGHNRVRSQWRADTGLPLPHLRRGCFARHRRVRG